jgi:hypothetical protein
MCRRVEEMTARLGECFPQAKEVDLKKLAIVQLRYNQSLCPDERRKIEPKLRSHIERIRSASW